jgi:hypothetical protein
MPVTYDECGPEEYEILGRLKRQYRDDLVEAKARIALFFVSDTESSNIPALMVRGKVARGSAKVNSVGDRAEGKADATIRLDRFCWERASPKERTALIHHELSRIGCPNPKKTDSLGRPVLKPVHADWETDGFDEIIQIYGEDAPEKINLNIIRERLRVQGLQFGEEDEDEATAATEESEAARGVLSASGVSSVEISAGGKSVTLTPKHFKKLKTIYPHPDDPGADSDPESGMLPEEGETESPSDRWRTIPLTTVCKRLSPEATAALHDEYELRTLGDIADFLAGGERLHELPLLGLDSAAILAEDIDIFRCDQGGGSAEGIKAEWLADTLRAYSENAIESAKVKKAPKTAKGKAKAQATA